MIFNKFKINAAPFFCDAYCKCGKELIEVSNGFLSSSLFCQKCENVYEIKMVKVPKKRLSKDYLEQCREEASKERKQII